MKRFLEIILAVCMMASVLCLNVFAAEAPASDIVLRVSALKEGESTPEVIKEYTSFIDGWNDAMKLAGNEDEMEKNNYDRVVVDLYADWVPGNFGTGDGFKSNAIMVPEDACVTINANGHTINRGLYKIVKNGGVMYIDENADVIINDATITGGDNLSAAGGIQIMDKAKVTLNNVNVVGNRSTSSDGAGIAVYDGAVLVMNGGSISNNTLHLGDLFFLFTYPYGTLYVNDSTVTLNDVTISNNCATTGDAEGVAIYADDSTVTLNNCVVSGNATAENGRYAESVIVAFDSKLIIKNTDFTGNGAVSPTYSIDYSLLFHLDDTTLTMEGGKITGNNADKLFYFNDSEADIKGVTITDNASVVLDVNNGSEKVTMTECVLNNNTPVKELKNVIVDEKGTLVMNDCTLGNTTFEDKNMVAGVGSIFSEGSLPMVVSITALLASVAGIGVSVSLNKKKADPEKATSEDDE